MDETFINTPTRPYAPFPLQPSSLAEHFSQLRRMLRARHHLKPLVEGGRRPQLVLTHRGKAKREKIRGGAARKVLRRPPPPRDGLVDRGGGSGKGRRGQARRGAVLLRGCASWDLSDRWEWGEGEEDVAAAGLEWRPLRREVTGALGDTPGWERGSLRGLSFLPGPSKTATAFLKRSRSLEEPPEG